MYFNSFLLFCMPLRTVYTLKEDAKSDLKSYFKMARFNFSQPLDLQADVGGEVGDSSTAPNLSSPEHIPVPATAPPQLCCPLQLAPALLHVPCGEGAAGFVPILIIPHFLAFAFPKAV